MALPEIPLLDVGADWPTATLEAQLDRAHALLNEGGAPFPRFALGIADALRGAGSPAGTSPILRKSSAFQRSSAGPAPTFSTSAMNGDARRRRDHRLMAGRSYSCASSTGPARGSGATS